jgi:hypothetical protein
MQVGAAFLNHLAKQRIDRAGIAGCRNGRARRHGRGRSNLHGDGRRHLDGSFLEHGSLDCCRRFRGVDSGASRCQHERECAGTAPHRDRYLAVRRRVGERVVAIGLEFGQAFRRCDLTQHLGHEFLAERRSGQALAGPVAIQLGF